MEIEYFFQKSSQKCFRRLQRRDSCSKCVILKKSTKLIPWKYWNKVIFTEIFCWQLLMLMSWTLFLAFVGHLLLRHSWVVVSNKKILRPYMMNISIAPILDFCSPFWKYPFPIFFFFFFEYIVGEVWKTNPRLILQETSPPRSLGAFCPLRWNFCPLWRNYRTLWWNHCKIIYNVEVGSL